MKSRKDTRRLSKTSARKSESSSNSQTMVCLGTFSLAKLSSSPVPESDKGSYYMVSGYATVRKTKGSVAVLLTVSLIAHGQAAATLRMKVCSAGPVENRVSLKSPAEVTIPLEEFLRAVRPTSTMMRS